MTINWKQYERIRQLNADGKTKSFCASELGICRSTVDKYWNGETTPDDKKIRVVPESDLEKRVKNFASQFILETRGSCSGKQKLKIADLARAFRESGGFAPQSTLYRYLAEIFDDKPEVYIHLDFMPGEVMQVDWFEGRLEIRDVLYTLPFFLAVLPYSGDFFTFPTLNMKFESFAMGHVEAFHFFHGVPEKSFYDNLRTAVKFGVSAQAVKQPNFEKLAAHYGFKAIFMNQGKGNEKGAVEQCVKTCRSLLLTPIPKTNSLEEFYEMIKAKLLVYFGRHTASGSDKTIAEKAAIEVRNLRPLPAKDFVPATSKKTVVNKFSMVHFEGSQYSVQDAYALKSETIVWRAYDHEIWHERECVARHARSLEKSEIYIPNHVYNTLSQKKRAIPYSKALKCGTLSSEQEEFVRICDLSEKAIIVFTLLQLEDKYGKEIVKIEIEKSNLLKNHSLDQLVKNIEKNYKPIKSVKLINYSDFYADMADVADVAVPLDSIAAYDALIAGSSSNPQSQDFGGHQEGAEEEENDE